MMVYLDVIVTFDPKAITVADLLRILEETRETEEFPEWDVEGVWIGSEVEAKKAESLRDRVDALGIEGVKVEMEGPFEEVYDRWPRGASRSPSATTAGPRSPSGPPAVSPRRS